MQAFLASLSQPQSRQRQISFHYDIGNTFFELLLGKDSMSYSGGKYATQTDSLIEAQENKLRFLSTWLALPKDALILDLGSGWGNFALFAAENYGWNILSITRSSEQVAYSREQIRKHDLAKHVSVQNRDMISNMPNEKYDGIMMLESLEHVGRKHLQKYFQKVGKRLKPGAPLVVQSTGRYQPRPLDRWTQKYVFPGGYLPSRDEIMAAATEAGFRIEEFRDDTLDYVYTMNAWIHNLESHQEEIERAFGRPFYRLWYLWMHGARVGFEYGSMNLFRVLLRQPAG